MDCLLPWLTGGLAVVGLWLLIDTVVVYRKASARGRLMDKVARENARKFRVSDRPWNRGYRSHRIGPNP